MACLLWGQMGQATACAATAPDIKPSLQRRIDPSHQYLLGLVLSKSKRRLIALPLQFKLISESVLFLLKPLSCFSVGRHLDLSSSPPLVPV